MAKYTDVIFDAIVIGSGISGGWIAKELCEKGLKTLVLERGRMVQHIHDYPTMFKEPWDYPMGGALPANERKEYEKVGGWIDENKKHFFVEDSYHPYNEEKPFSWIRGYQVGGKSLTWARHCYRWSDLDFSANKVENIAIDWPIRYKDIAPWYDYVEEFAGISGESLELDHLPDGRFLKPFELNAVEKHVRQAIRKHFPERYLTMGRIANLTEIHNGRGPCQFRNRCDRGCPHSAYFSSNAVTLPAAKKTGNMTLRPHSVVSSIIYDEQKAVGVRVVDERTKDVHEYYSKLIFLNASTIASTGILLNSKSNRFPNGLGNDSGELGHNLMDHHFYVGAQADFKGFSEFSPNSGRPGGIYIPRFRNLVPSSRTSNFLRGYGYQGSAQRQNWNERINDHKFGMAYKDSLFLPGTWTMSITGFGECLPYHDNHVQLTKRRDTWGNPILSIQCEFKDNEIAMRKQIYKDAVNMFQAAGAVNIQSFNIDVSPGRGIHEMGTARMGHDPKTSVLNTYNQIHSVPNVFVTDGSCMTSSSCVNPSLTYMALSARAANYAVNALHRGEI
ncbi:MAG: GMC family oxidoreductase [Candidatus Marithrix sp.]